eukprot:CAMPEP_0206247152 /NCGR_PEP_ID=MMETSP0047_2-20121206/19654_1 /ASSEMBLY_ACC=CAM_ASM_000192 /TAXON_ID=195065 /ORGANISM="Chroomonas mesostigmatica_cf, Strain CCMP1168" /LENGTH=277 /DNA_ID=CAMNT_0053672651 /DNA_START=86 /DNA_END=919 /DNA_ORIENTATION=-
MLAEDVPSPAGLRVSVKSKLMAFNAPTVYQIQVTDRMGKNRFARTILVWADLVDNHKHLVERLLNRGVDVPELPARASGIVKSERVAQNEERIRGYLESLLRVDAVQEDAKTRRLLGIPEGVVGDGSNGFRAESLWREQVESPEAPEWGDFSDIIMTNKGARRSLGSVPQTQEEYMEHIGALKRSMEDSRDVNKDMTKRVHAKQPRASLNPEEYMEHVEALNHGADEVMSKVSKRVHTTACPNARHSWPMDRAGTASEHVRRILWADQPRKVVTFEL